MAYGDNVTVQYFPKEFMLKHNFREQSDDWFLTNKALKPYYYDGFSLTQRITNFERERNKIILTFDSNIEDWLFGGMVFEVTSSDYGSYQDPNKEQMPLVNRFRVKTVVNSTTVEVFIHKTAKGVLDKGLNYSVVLVGNDKTIYIPPIKVGAYDDTNDLYKSDSGNVFTYKLDRNTGISLVYAKTNNKSGINNRAYIDNAKNHKVIRTIGCELGFYSVSTNKWNASTMVSNIDYVLKISDDNHIQSFCPWDNNFNSSYGFFPLSLNSKQIYSSNGLLNIDDTFYHMYSNHSYYTMRTISNTIKNKDGTTYLYGRDYHIISTPHHIFGWSSFSNIAWKQGDKFRYIKDMWYIYKSGDEREVFVEPFVLVGYCKYLTIENYINNTSGFFYNSEIDMSYGRDIYDYVMYVSISSNKVTGDNLVYYDNSTCVISLLDEDWDSRGSFKISPEVWK